jgi:alkanesulfonate monooxygenase SsuD/methylene tetrahydromethanopterin reductase-like flavin-dependent oxidoreductase (luciferase family)
VSEGSTPAAALANTIDLARRAEAAGYRRYWVAEHHFAPGVASSSPAVLIGAIAANTSTIRVGSGAVQLGHQTSLAVTEAFGTLSALYPGRIDLGLGRSGQRRQEARKEAAKKAAAGEDPEKEARIVDGLLIPPPYSFSHLLRSPRFGLQSRLLQQPGAQSPDFGDQLDDIFALLSGTWQSEDGVAVQYNPGSGTDAEIWILGSSAGQSARAAGALGLPFAANYHVSPATVLEAVAAYRDAFKPSAVLSKPHVLVSADVVVAPTEEEARELAAPYGLWVRSIRSGAGAMKFASPESAAEALAKWTDEDRALVEDRVSTQFTGSPATVARQLRILQDATGADELLTTTITYRHQDRVRSAQLLAREWGLA